MANALSKWMIRSATGQSTSTSPLVLAGRQNGLAVIIPVYAGGVIASVVMAAISSPFSTGLYVFIRLLMVLLWAGIGLLFVFIGTKLSHTMATWGVGLAGAVALLLTALSDFSVSTLLEGFVWIGFLDLILAGGFAWATVEMFRAMTIMDGIPGKGGDHVGPGTFPVQPPFAGGPPPTYLSPPAYETTPPAHATPPPSDPIGASADLEKRDAVTAADPTLVPSAETPSAPTPVAPYGAGVHGAAIPQYGYVPGTQFPPAGPNQLGFGGAVPPQNAMATPALILGILVPPAGIIFGHISLSQIKRTHESGRQLATAGLVIGYILTGIAIASWLAIFAFTASVTNSINSSLDEYAAATTTATETTPAGYTPNPSNPIGNVIRTTAVGACVHRESSGTSVTVLYTAECSSSSANYEVTDRVTSTSDCGSTWVQTPADAYYSSNVVLCLSVN